MHPRPTSKTTRIVAFSCIVFIEYLTLLRSDVRGECLAHASVTSAVQRIFTGQRYILRSPLSIEWWSKAQRVDAL